MKRIIQSFKFIMEAAAETLPWLVIINSAFLARRMYFTDISAEVSATLFVVFTNFLMFIWLTIKPFESVCRSWIMKIIYNLLPVELFLFSFFAERHFILSIFICVLTIAAPIVTYNLMLRWGKGVRNHYAYKCACGEAAKKHYLVLAVLILAMPTFVGIQIKDKPYAEAKLVAETLKEVDLKEEEIDLVEENGAILAYLEEEKWDKLNKNEKMNVLQTVVNIECTRFGTPPVQIVGNKLREGVLGAYNPQNNTISIDIEVLTASTAADCVRTVGHEVRHAYQHSVVAVINWNDQRVQKSQYFAKARSWKEAFDNYVSGQESFEDYYNQSVEADAREYGFVCENIIYADYINPPSDEENTE